VAGGSARGACLDVLSVPPAPSTHARNAGSSSVSSRFYFGPVPSDFVWGKSPYGFGVQWPPDFSAGGFLHPAGKVGVITLDGQRYFRVPETITKYGTTCSNLVLWVY
jgi:hypothetical protein